jgi:hypothetical protein
MADLAVMLERREPLTRKTPLRTDPAVMRSWRDRTRKWLPRESVKRRRERKQRTDFVGFVLKHRPVCEAQLRGCTLVSHDVNELQRGPAREDCWLDYDRVTALCRSCHDWLTLHPTWAEHHGHQLRHEVIVTDEAWETAAKLRAHFRREPCTAHCVVDHWEVAA